METTTMNIPVLALRGLTAFPNLTLSLEAEREISIFALDQRHAERAQGVPRDPA